MIGLPINVLIVGSGAREHVIGWKILQSPLLSRLFFAPGNAGTSAVATNLSVKIPKIRSSEKIWKKYFREILGFCVDLEISLVVVQNENPIAAGLVDFLRSNGVRTFGPTALAAAIESSKIWANEFMEEFGIPHPRATAVLYPDMARQLKLPEEFKVVKADGLAEGKGVHIGQTSREVTELAESILENGDRVLIQEFLEGWEVSAHAFTDGVFVAQMPDSCDYKKLGEANKGENTGGVGAYCPAFGLTEEDSIQIGEITERTISFLANDHRRRFEGVLYPGLFVTEDGIKVIEYNCRFGDPEAQVLLPKLKTDFLEVMMACIEGWLGQIEIEWDDDYAVCVVLCSGGYPNTEKMTLGVPISGLDQVPDDILVFHAGTGFNNDGKIVTTSGRVLSIVAKGKSLEEARNKVYSAIENIGFEKMIYRESVGQVV